ncbi:hypothetical protein CDAR_63581 [Caerostris darwini]|uniref:Secreted protein n=1 Tax=Caerostris darwini TaxID=1538125 RepID=A0AAV4QI53_9ARAC|nr:hypothetical protein CDAR_63581 [Caerostris darwini]
MWVRHCCRTLPGSRVCAFPVLVSAVVIIGFPYFRLPSGGSGETIRISFQPTYSCNRHVNLISFGLCLSGLKSSLPKGLNLLGHTF